MAARTEIAPLLKADIDERIRVGTETYGSPLAVESPNDALQYAYEEALDLCFYLKQELVRRDVAARDQAEFIETLRPRKPRMSIEAWEDPHTRKHRFEQGYVGPEGQESWHYSF